MKTRERILESARLLFNSYGYRNVSIRMISNDLKISPGNFNYHFRRKDEILEILYFRMVDTFKARIEKNKNEQAHFKKLKHDLNEEMNIMLDYKFIWTDLHHIRLQFKYIDQHFRKTYPKRIKSYQFLFFILQQKNLMQAKLNKYEDVQLAECIISYSDTYIFNNPLESSNEINMLKQDYAEKSLLLFYPYLTQKGKHELNKELIWTEAIL